VVKLLDLCTVDYAVKGVPPTVTIATILNRMRLCGYVVVVTINCIKKGDNMAENVDQKVWEEKDLRIVRQNALAHATAIMTCREPGEQSSMERWMDDLFNIASSCVCFVYQGMKFPGEKQESNIGKSNNDISWTDEQLDVLHAIATEAGIPSSMIDSLAAEIIRVFGKLPTNVKSVPKVISSIDFERVK